MSFKTGSFLASRTGIILTGLIIGLSAVVLQKLGNPPNMGICVSSFLRDIAGGIGLHRASSTQFIRPELIGFVTGSFIAAIIFREFKAGMGSSSLVRFFLGIFAAVGTLAFLGCPWRMTLRIAGGDFNAVIGLIGLTAGVGLGALFKKYGFTLGKTRNIHKSTAYLFPAIVVILAILLFFKPPFVHFSQKGPGSMHAPIIISLIVGLGIGFLAQRSRFCLIGAIGNIFTQRSTLLAGGLVAMLVAAFVMNLIFGSVKFSFSGQPIAHSNYLWNFLGMVLAGLSFTLAGGCPGRQLFMAGEGNLDAGIFITGMVVGASFANNLRIAGRPDTIVDGLFRTGGITSLSMFIVIAGLIVCTVIGLKMKESEAEKVFEPVN